MAEMEYETVGKVKEGVVWLIGRGVWDAKVEVSVVLCPCDV
jgi:hypothetical protein